MKAAVSKNDRLLPIFDELKKLLAKYEPPLAAKTDAPDRYELEFNKDYEIKSERTGRTAVKHGLFFAGIIVQKHYVGLYFMPVYSHPGEFSGISPSLRRILKRKSCFYVGKIDEELKTEIAVMLEKGFRLYGKLNSGKPMPPVTNLVTHHPRGPAWWSGARARENVFRVF